jgi:hypothetical protein
MKQNDVSNVETPLSNQNYENLFNVYQDSDGFYYYNLSRAIYFPSNLDPTYYTPYAAEVKDTWPLIAWKFYKNVKLWWIICSANQIINPVIQPFPGYPLKIIKPNVVNNILIELARS